MRASTFFLSLFFLCSTANAGLFDDIINKTKQTADQVMDQSIHKVMGDSSDEQEQQQPAATSPKPHYDTALVKSIQQHLKDQGYLTGSVDGLYGNGTRTAIQSYQQDHGMTADGVPTQTLLAQLQSSASQANTAKQNASSVTASSGWPEPTMAALTLAAVHYRPDSLNDENVFKSVLYDVHPETNPIMSNEFKWHKQKAQLKQQLLDEAKTAQLQFEIKPWRDEKKLYKPLELLQYDFDRSGFRTRILLATLIPSQCRLEKQYPQGVNLLTIDADQAEQIDNYFHHNRHIVYPSYRIKVTGADLNSGRPLPIVNFDDNRLKLYARENTPAGNQMKIEYKQLVTTSIPYDKAILAKESAPKEFGNNKSVNTDVVKNAVIDGIHLGMSMDDALAILKANGFAMESPGQPDSLVGIRVNGNKITDDGKGSIKVYFSSMNGKVYQFVEEVMYLANRLPTGKTMADIEQQYKDKFIAPFKEARYSAKIFNGRIAFDDEQREPYSSPIMSPHAEVIISTGQRFGANLNMTWKGLVGANW